MALLDESRRIGVFYDGNFLLHASNYYNYIHPVKRRLSVGGLHRFIQQRVAEEEGVNPFRCQIAEAHYFRGRLNAADAAGRGNQLYNDRVFDDILMSEGVHAHYLPLRNLLGKREERGVDVWLSLTAFEMVLQNRFDVVVLIVADTDYTPLIRKILSYGIRVMLLSWEFEYTNDEGVRMTTKTSHELLNIASYPVAMHDVIDAGIEQNNSLITDLFVSYEPPRPTAT
ncbi:MAG: NYN domain-containing protein, partial [Alistipes sp.]|nr:NYN domain-containing protein [Alistipes sp.]